MLKLLQTLHLLCFQELINAAEMLANATMAKLVNLAHEAVQEVAVMAYHDERAVKILQRLLQHILCLKVQVVRWLVKDEQVHRLKQKRPTAP